MKRKNKYTLLLNFEKENNTEKIKRKKEMRRKMKRQRVMGKTTTNNIPENAADIISPNLQESMRSNNQRAAIINHQKHK